MPDVRSRVPAVTWTIALLLSPAAVHADEPTIKGSSTSKGAPTVYDFGAVGDGKADDGDAIRKAVAARIGEVRLPRGVYRITTPIVIDLEKVGWTSVTGSGTARIVMDGPGPALRFVGTHAGTADPSTVLPNVWERQRMPTVDGIEIVGTHEQAVGIEATGTVQLTITRALIRNTLHGIHLVKRNRNVLVSACHLYRSTGVGLYLDDVSLHQINVAGCHISYNGGGGIVVRGGGVCNLQISGCDIEANMALDGPPTANVLVDGNGVNAEVAIVGCTIQHTHRAPDSANVRFLGADRQGRIWGNLTVNGNVISDSQFGIDLRQARAVSIAGNTFWKGYQYALRIEDSRNVVIGPNVFDRNPAYWDPDGGHNALVLRRCQDATLTGLHINGVTGTAAGLVLEDCRRVNVTQCTILDCASGGLLFRDVSDSRVSDCLIRNDRKDRGSWFPLKILGGRGNMVVDNLLGRPCQIDPAVACAHGNVTPPPEKETP